MTSVEKRHSGRRSSGHRKHSDGGYSDTSSAGSFLDETDREVSNLTDRAFRSLCIGDEAIYNDSDLCPSSPTAQRERQQAFGQGGLDQDGEDRGQLKRAAQQSFSLRVQQYGPEWIEGGLYGAEPQMDLQLAACGERSMEGRLSPTFQHSFTDKSWQEKSLNEDHSSLLSNGATELSSQQRRSRSRVSSLIKAFNSEGYRDSGGLDGKLRELNDETSWDKSALISIQRELSEFSTAYQQSFDRGPFPSTGPFSSQNNRFYTSEVATAVAHMDSTSSFMRSSHSRHSMSTQHNSNFFMHSEFSPFKVWRDHNRFPFQHGEVSGFMPHAEFSKWYETPMYKELSLEPQQVRSTFEEDRFRPQRKILEPAVPKPPLRSTSTSTVLQKTSSLKKRCESEVTGHYPPWKQTQSLGANRLPSQRPSTISPTIQMSRHVQDTLSSISDLRQQLTMMTSEQSVTTEVIAKQKVLRSNDSLMSYSNNNTAVTVEQNVVSSHTSKTPFNISQLMTPVIHTHQEMETSGIQLYAGSPPTIEHPPVRAESRGATPDARTSSYRSRATSLLFNLKDNRKRVKSTYSPTKFKGLEMPDKTKQPAKLAGTETRDTVIDIPDFPDQDIQVPQAVAHEEPTSHQPIQEQHSTGLPLTASSFQPKTAYTSQQAQYTSGDYPTGQVQREMGHYAGYSGLTQEHYSDNQPMNGKNLKESLSSFSQYKSDETDMMEILAGGLYRQGSSPKLGVPNTPSMVTSPPLKTNVSPNKAPYWAFDTPRLNVDHSNQAREHTSVVSNVPEVSGVRFKRADRYERVQDNKYCYRDVSTQDSRKQHYQNPETRWLGTTALTDKDQHAQPSQRAPVVRDNFYSLRDRNGEENKWKMQEEQKTAEQMLISGTPSHPQKDVFSPYHTSVSNQMHQYAPLSINSVFKDTTASEKPQTEELKDNVQLQNQNGFRVKKEVKGNNLAQNPQYPQSNTEEEQKDGNQPTLHFDKDNLFMLQESSPGKQNAALHKDNDVLRYQQKESTHHYDHRNPSSSSGNRQHDEIAPEMTNPVKDQHSLEVKAEQAGTKEIISEHAQTEQANAKQEEWARKESRTLVEETKTESARTKPMIGAQTKSIQMRAPCPKDELPEKDRAEKTETERERTEEAKAKNANDDRAEQIKVQREKEVQKKEEIFKTEEDKVEPTKQKQGEKTSPEEPEAHRIKVEEIKAEPNKHIPTKQARTQKTTAESSRGEWMRAEQLNKEKIKTEQVKGEQMRPKLCQTESMTTEQTKVQKSKAEQAEADVIKAESNKEEQVKMAQKKMQPATTEQLKAEREKTKPVAAGKIKANHTIEQPKTEIHNSEAVEEADQATTGQVTASQVTSEQTERENMTEEPARSKEKQVEPIKREPDKVELVKTELAKTKAELAKIKEKMRGEQNEQARSAASRREVDSVNKDSLVNLTFTKNEDYKEHQLATQKHKQDEGPAVNKYNRVQTHMGGDVYERIREKYGFSHMISSNRCDPPPASNVDDCPRPAIHKDQVETATEKSKDEISPVNGALAAEGEDQEKELSIKYDEVSENQYIYSESSKEFKLSSSNNLPTHKNERTTSAKVKDDRKEHKNSDKSGALKQNPNTSMPREIDFAKSLPSERKPKTTEHGVLLHKDTHSSHFKLSHKERAQTKQEILTSKIKAHAEKEISALKEKGYAMRDTLTLKTPGKQLPFAHSSHIRQRPISQEVSKGKETIISNNITTKKPPGPPDAATLPDKSLKPTIQLLDSPSLKQVPQERLKNQDAGIHQTMETKQSESNDVRIEEKLKQKPAVIEQPGNPSPTETEVRAPLGSEKKEVKDGENSGKENEKEGLKTPLRPEATAVNESQTDSSVVKSPTPDKVESKSKAIAEDSTPSMKLVLDQSESTVADASIQIMGITVSVRERKPLVSSSQTDESSRVEKGNPNNFEPSSPANDACGDVPAGLTKKKDRVEQDKLPAAGDNDAKIGISNEHSETVQEASSRELLNYKTHLINEKRAISQEGILSLTEGVPRGNLLQDVLDDKDNAPAVKNKLSAETQPLPLKKGIATRKAKDYTNTNDNSAKGEVKHESEMNVEEIKLFGGNPHQINEIATEKIIQSREKFNRSNTEDSLMQNLQTSTKENISPCHVMNPSKSGNIESDNVLLVVRKRKDSMPEEGNQSYKNSEPLKSSTGNENRHTAIARQYTGTHIGENSQDEDGVHIDSIAIRVVPGVIEKDSQEMTEKHPSVRIPLNSMSAVYENKQIALQSPDGKINISPDEDRAKVSTPTNKELRPIKDSLEARYVPPSVKQGAHSLKLSDQHSSLITTSENTPAENGNPGQAGATKVALKRLTPMDEYFELHGAIPTNREHYDNGVIAGDVSSTVSEGTGRDSQHQTLNRGHIAEQDFPEKPEGGEITSLHPDKVSVSNDVHSKQEPQMVRDEAFVSNEPRKATAESSSASTSSTSTRSTKMGQDIHITKHDTANKSDFSAKEGQSTKKVFPTRDKVIRGNVDPKPEVKVKPKDRVSAIPEISALADYARLKVIAAEDNADQIQGQRPSKGKEGFIPRIQTRHSRRPVFTTGEMRDPPVKEKTRAKEPEISANVNREPKSLVFSTMEQQHKKTGMFKLGVTEKQENMIPDVKANKDDTRRIQDPKESVKSTTAHQSDVGRRDIQGVIQDNDVQDIHPLENNPLVSVPDSASSSNGKTRKVSFPRHHEQLGNFIQHDIPEGESCYPQSERRTNTTERGFGLQNNRMEERGAAERGEKSNEKQGGERAAQMEEERRDNVREEAVTRVEEERRMKQVKEQRVAQIEETTAKQKEEEEERAKLREEEERRVKQKEEEARRVQQKEEEERAKQKEEQERRAKQREEEEKRAKQREEEERRAKKKEEEERRAKLREEEERRAKQKEEEEERAKQREEERRAKQKEEEERRAKLREEEERRVSLKEEEERRAKQKEEEEQRAKQREEERRAKQKEEEERRAKLREEEERRAKQKEEEERAKQKEEEERRVKLREEEVRRAKLKEEEEKRAKLREEEEWRAKQKEEEERRARQREEEERRAKQREEEERRVKQREEEERRAKQREEEERRAKLREEEERRAKQKEEERRRAKQREEEERRTKQKEEEERRVKQKEEERRAKQKEEERRAKQKEEAERKFKQIEEEGRRAKLREEEERRAKQKEGEERRVKQKEAERRARLKEEEMRAKLKEEEERRAKLKEEEARRIKEIVEQRRVAREEERRRAKAIEEQMRAKQKGEEKRATQIEEERREQQREEGMAAQKKEAKRTSEKEENKKANQREEEWRAKQIEGWGRNRQSEEEHRAIQREEERMAAQERLVTLQERSAEQREEEDDQLAVQGEGDKGSQELKRVSEQRRDALQYYSITSIEGERRPKERHLHSPLPSERRAEPPSMAVLTEDSYSRPYAPPSPAPHFPRSNTSSPAPGAKPTMFRVKDNTFRGSSLTKSVKPRFYKSFGDDFRVSSPLEAWRGSERADEEQDRMRSSSGTPLHHDPPITIGSNRLPSVKETSLLQSVASSQAHPVEHKAYSRRSIALDEDDSHSIISNLSEDVESFATSAADLAELRGVYDDDRPESACSFSSDASRSLGRPPVVPPKSEKALRRAKRLATRRIKKEQSKSATEMPTRMDKPLCTIAAAPSSPTELPSSNRHVLASPHFSAPISLAHAPPTGSTAPPSLPSAYRSFHASPHTTAPVSLPITSSHAVTPVSLPVASAHLVTPVAHPRTVASVPSSPTLHHASHPVPVTQYRVEPSFTQPFPLTQRRVLQDPGSGQYFVVDLPVQVKTKTFFDPETGKYVQLNVRQSAQTGSLPQSQSGRQVHPQPKLQSQPQLQPPQQPHVQPQQLQPQPYSQVSPAGKPYVRHQGYQGYPQISQTMPVSSLPPHRSSSGMSRPATLPQNPETTREIQNYGYVETDLYGERHSPDQTPYLDTAYDTDKIANTDPARHTHGSHQTHPAFDTNSQLESSSMYENESSAQSTLESRDIITMGELEDFMELSDW